MPQINIINEKKNKKKTKNKKTKAKNKSHLTEEKVIYTVYN